MIEMTTKIEVEIRNPSYKLRDYEKVFLQNEIMALTGVEPSLDSENDRYTLHVDSNFKLSKLELLTYADSVEIKLGFSKEDVDEASSEGVNSLLETIQKRLERPNGKGRQRTTYGPHGLHEYRGKFNPQMPRSLMVQNFLDRKGVILDPFCGSGTTLIEASMLNLPSIGIDINPMSCLITNAKIAWLEVDEIPNLPPNFDAYSYEYDEQRETFLRKWFPEDRLSNLRQIIGWSETLDSNHEKIAKCVLSNLLREHSFQDPAQLRIMRRENIPESTLPLIDCFRNKWNNLSDARMKYGKVSTEKPTCLQGSSIELIKAITSPISGTVSSPPYATALPYIDTYRLSSVALMLNKNTEITSLEKSLIGARDISAADKALYDKRLESLPKPVRKIINQLKSEVDHNDEAGFRLKAKPYALARYFSSMQDVILELFEAEQKGALNTWVVGPSKTNPGKDKTKSGEFDIDTPRLLAHIAEEVGFDTKLRKVEAYSRLDIHSKNSIRKEYILSFIR
jgi:hypothetical protein